MFGGKGAELPAQSINAEHREETAASQKKVGEITAAALLI